MAYGIPGASPNLVAQQQRITALPSDPQETVLARYLVQLTQQNKVGTPEYYLAAGEFQNRQKMRQEQAAKQQQGPKVVENLTAQAVQKAAPQMAMAAPMARGVGALDAGGMDRIESPVYTGAMGGIVAFDEGGQAKSDSGNDQIEQLYTTNLMRASDPEGYRFWSQKFGPDVDAAERALFIAEAAPEVQRRVAAGETNLPEFMRVDPAVRRALQSQDITTDEYKTLANYFGNQWIGGEAEDPASLTRRDYIERPRSGYDLATFLATRSQEHGAQPDTPRRMANLVSPYLGETGVGRVGDDEQGVVNPITGETERVTPLGVENLYRAYRRPHHGTIGGEGNRFAVATDYKIDPETGKAYYVGPYTEAYTDLGHRDMDKLKIPLAIAGTAIGMNYFPGFGLENMINRGLVNLGVNAASRIGSRMASGGEVKRYQGQGPSFVQSSTSPFMRDVQAFSEAGRQSMLERTPGMMGRFNRPLISAEEDERMRLIQLLNQKFGGQGSLIQGYFTEQSPAQREQAKDIVQRIPTMSLNELRSLAGVTSTAAPAAVQTTGQRFVGSNVQGSGADVRKSDIAAGGVNSPAMPPTTPPYMPQAMREQPPVSIMPAAPSMEAILAKLGGGKEGIAGLTTKQSVTDIKDAMKEAGYDPEFFKKQIKDIEGKKAATKADKEEAQNMRLIEAGLGILGGESPYAFVNIGKGASPAIKGLQEDLKDIRKLNRDYDKSIRDLQAAEQSGNRDIALKAVERRDRIAEKIEDRKFDMARTIYSGEIQKQIAAMPGATERLISRLGEPGFASLAEKYGKLLGPGASSGSRVDAAILQEYAKNPWKLEALKDSDPNLYNYIKAQLSALSVPSAISAPTGKVRE